jgi:integral membrane sensor domain MASE1
MLKWSYLHFGFFGTIFLALFLFLSFIVYVAGLAGIADSQDDKSKNIKLIIGIFIPVYPVIWLIFDMRNQRKALKS